MPILEVFIFFDEDDMCAEKRLYEYNMQNLIHYQFMGATLFVTMGGYGHKRQLHYPRRIGVADLGPLVLISINETEKFGSVLPHLNETVREGLIVTRNVDRVV